MTAPVPKRSTEPMSEADALRQMLATESGLSFDEPRDGLQLFTQPGAEPLVGVTLRCTLCGAQDIDQWYVNAQNPSDPPSVARHLASAASEHWHRPTPPATEES